MSRKIKDIKDKHTGELVYPRTHVSAVVFTSDSTLEDIVDVKQDKIDDLDEIRDGAAKGKTALQSIPSEYVTETELNDKGFLTEHQDISHLASKEWVNNKNYATEYDLKTIDYSSINNVPVSEDETGELNITDENGNIGMKVASEAVYAKDFVAGEHKLSEKVDKTYVDNSIAELVDGAPETLDTLNELAAALNDNADIVDVLNQSISNKQDAITDLETIRQGAAKGATALQSYTEQYKGTVTGVKVNGTNKNPSNGVVDLGTVITAHQTLKTINGESIVGSGDITISGGSSDANVQAVDTGDVLDDVTVNYATKTYVDGLIGDINSVLESIIGYNEDIMCDFFIDNLAFTFENGMTFDEWIDSEYNFLGYIKSSISDNVYRVANSTGNFISYNGVWVVSTDKIAKDGIYKTGL